MGYLYAGERSWLGNIDAIQLEWSKEYRDFNTALCSAGEITTGGYIQLKRVSEFINEVNKYYKAILSF